MVVVNFKWKGRECQQEFDEAVEASWPVLGQFMVDKVQEALSEPYPPASEPGEPPHYRTKELLNSVGFKMDDGKLEITASALHAKFLEKGTRNMEARPFLKVTIEDNIEEGIRRFAEEVKRRMDDAD